MSARARVEYQKYIAKKPQDGNRCAGSVVQILSAKRGFRDEAGLSPKIREIPSEILEHLEALKNYGCGQSKAGVRVTLELLSDMARLQDLEALRHLPSLLEKINFWWETFQSVNDKIENYRSPYQSSAQSSQRSSIASNFQSSIDARSSVSSFNTAHTDLSTLSKNSESANRLPPQLPQQYRSTHLPLRSTPAPKIYHCTSCENKSYSRRTDWMSYEKGHYRHGRWDCRCNLSFSTERAFKDHHKTDHGCAKCDHANVVAVYTNVKTSFGCGFCGIHFHDLDKRNDHIASHFKAGKTKADWDFFECDKRSSSSSRCCSRMEKFVENTRASNLNFSMDENTRSIVESLERQNYKDDHGIAPLLHRLYTLAKFIPPSRNASEVLSSEYQPSANLAPSTLNSEPFPPQSGPGNAKELTEGKTSIHSNSDIAFSLVRLSSNNASEKVGYTSSARAKLAEDLPRTNQTSVHGLSGVDSNINHTSCLPDNIDGSNMLTDGDISEFANYDPEDFNNLSFWQNSWPPQSTMTDSTHHINTRDNHHRNNSSVRRYSANMELDPS